MVRPVAPPAAPFEASGAPYLSASPSSPSSPSGRRTDDRSEAYGPAIRRALSSASSRSWRSWRPPRVLVIGVAVVAVLVVAGAALLGAGTVGSSKVGLDEQLPLSRASAAPAGSGATVPAPAAVPVGAASAVPVGQAPASASALLSTSTTSSTVTPSGLVVHAAGALVAPGVYVMEPGTRLADLVVAAGGLAADADPDVINLAAPLRDGQRIFVPHRGKPVPSVVVGIVDGAATAVGGGDPGATGSPSAGSDTTSGTPAPVDLNTASAEQLDALPGVGPATAAAIIEHRTRVGPFRSVTQLLDVPGIGEAKLAALRRRVTVAQG